MSLRFCLGSYIAEDFIAEIRTLLIDEKNYKDLMIYFTRYVHSKSIKILSLYYHKLIGKNEEHEGKKYLMVDDYIVNKVLDKIKKIIGIEHFDILKFWMTDDKLPDDITFKNVLILMTCVIKDDDKFYPQPFLEETLSEA